MTKFGEKDVWQILFDSHSLEPAALMMVKLLTTTPLENYIASRAKILADPDNNFNFHILVHQLFIDAEFDETPAFDVNGKVEIAGRYSFFLRNHHNPPTAPFFQFTFNHSGFTSLDSFGQAIDLSPGRVVPIATSIVLQILTALYNHRGVHGDGNQA